MIIADTGPLNYLVRTGNIELLPRLFGAVYIPFEVQEELKHERTPKDVRAWVFQPPAWLTVSAPGPRIVQETGLHPGELAAIALAEHLGRQTLLIDDRRGRQEAILRGLPVIGTVGILFQAGISGFVDFEEELVALVQTNFHLSRALRDRYLQLWRAARPGK